MIGSKELWVFVGATVLIVASILIFISRSLPPIGLPPGDQIMKPANEVVGALDLYADNEGEFPDTLDRLVPNYLEKIPPPDWGTRRWDYSRSNDHMSYILSVRMNLSNWNQYFYSSEMDEWAYDNS